MDFTVLYSLECGKDTETFVDMERSMDMDFEDFGLTVSAAQALYNLFSCLPFRYVIMSYDYGIIAKYPEQEKAPAWQFWKEKTPAWQFWREEQEKFGCTDEMYWKNIRYINNDFIRDSYYNPFPYPKNYTRFQCYKEYLVAFSILSNRIKWQLEHHIHVSIPREVNITCVLGPDHLKCNCYKELAFVRNRLYGQHALEDDYNLTYNFDFEYYKVMHYDELPSDYNMKRFFLC